MCKIDLDLTVTAVLKQVGKIPSSRTALCGWSFSLYYPLSWGIVTPPPPDNTVWRCWWSATVTHGIPIGLAV